MTLPGELHKIYSLSVLNLQPNIFGNDTTFKNYK